MLFVVKFMVNSALWPDPAWPRANFAIHTGPAAENQQKTNKPQRHKDLGVFRTSILEKDKHKNKTIEAQRSITESQQNKTQRTEGSHWITIDDSTKRFSAILRAFSDTFPVI